jgi:hypothetical protein
MEIHVQGSASEKKTLQAEKLAWVNHHFQWVNDGYPLVYGWIYPLIAW